jgi:hypothetical protein
LTASARLGGRPGGLAKGSSAIVKSVLVIAAVLARNFGRVER